VKKTRNIFSDLRTEKLSMSFDHDQNVAELVKSFDFTNNVAELVNGLLILRFVGKH